MAAKVPATTRAIADQAQIIGSLLRQKLLAQLTVDQRELLTTADELIDLNDAVFAGDPDRIVNNPPTNLSPARIAAEVLHGELLLTGYDPRELYEEDRANMDASRARACKVD